MLKIELSEQDMKTIHESVMEKEIDQMMQYMLSVRKNSEITNKLIKKKLIERYGRQTTTETVIDQNIKAYNIWKRTKRYKQIPEERQD